MEDYDEQVNIELNDAWDLVSDLGFATSNPFVQIAALLMELAVKSEPETATDKGEWNATLRRVKAEIANWQEVE